MAPEASAVEPVAAARMASGASDPHAYFTLVLPSVLLDN
jgi:hypothetical protein